MFYNRFRCTHSFKGIKDMLWSCSEDSRKWRNRRRHGVLGYWRQLKTFEWHWHIGACEASHSKLTKRPTNEYSLEMVV